MIKFIEQIRSNGISSEHIINLWISESNRKIQTENEKWDEEV